MGRNSLVRAALDRASGARRPTKGQRLEDGRPEGQNLAQPGFGSRQPPPVRGQAQSRSDVNSYRLLDKTVAKGLAK